MVFCFCLETEIALDKLYFDTESGYRILNIEFLSKIINKQI